MIKDVAPLLKECEETLKELKRMGNMEVACYVQGFINSINKLPDVNQRPPWIPCSERLPDKDQVYYLVTINYGNITVEAVRFFWNKERMWNENKEYITAWMPLPAPYQEEGEKNE